MPPIAWVVIACLGIFLAIAAIMGIPRRDAQGRLVMRDSALRLLVPVGAYAVVGALLGAAAIFGITLMVQQDTKPLLPGGDPSSSVLNRVEYGNRS